MDGRNLAVLELLQRRKFFDEYPESYAGGLPSLAKFKIRFTCPCCGYPTIGERSAYEICFLCSWEDDGEDDHNLDEPSAANHEMSLAEARSNFAEHGVMYQPGSDPRITGGDTPAEQSTKAQVCEAFQAMRSPPFDQHELYWQAVVRGERELYRLLKLAIREYESRNA